MPRPHATCPACARSDGLGTVSRLVLPGDRRADEIVLEVLACACGFTAVGVTEAAQRMNLRGGGERIGYRLPAAAVDLVAFLVARCPDPAEEFCTCPAHASLNRRDLRNQWNLLHSFAPFGGFALAPQTIAWEKAEDGYRAQLEGRAWALRFAGADAGPPYELSIDDAIGLELDELPPFWRLGTA